MYFGYGQIWRFTFVPAGFVIVMAAFVALCLVYLVGASSGSVGAARFLRATMVAFASALALDVVFSVVSGQLGAFVRSLGWSPLVEMAALAALCVGSMWFMAVSYVASKQREGI